MARKSPPAAVDPQWKTLSRNDWSDLLELSEKKTYRRKFALVECFVSLVAERGLLSVSHRDIARHANVSRQQVDHHFPRSPDLITLAYRYIYARLQKVSADAVTSRKGFHNQFHAYLEVVPRWIIEQPADARFLVQFYALFPLHEEWRTMHLRNLTIGQDRMVSLFREARPVRGGGAPTLTDKVLYQVAAGVQQQLIGYIVLASGGPPSDLVTADGLLQNCETLVARAGLG